MRRHTHGGKEDALQSVKEDPLFVAITKADRALDRVIRLADERKMRSVGDLADEAKENLSDARRAALKRFPPKMSPALRSSLERIRKHAERKETP